MKVVPVRSRVEASILVISLVPDLAMMSRWIDPAGFPLRWQGMGRYAAGLSGA